MGLKQNSRETEENQPPEAILLRTVLSSIDIVPTDRKRTENIKPACLNGEMTKNRIGREKSIMDESDVMDFSLCRGSSIFASQ